MIEMYSKYRHCWLIEPFLDVELAFASMDILKDINF